MNRSDFQRQADWIRYNWIPIVVAITVFLGVLLRIGQYLPGRSLWIDEAMLTLNIVSRTYQELLQPLSDNQGAPLGFLWIEKCVTQFLGNGEFALRLFPLVTGLCGLVIFPFVAREYLAPRAVLWALILFATSDLLIYYSSEVKQYSSDVLVTILSLAIFVYLFKNQLRAIDGMLFGLAGAGLMWFSHPAIFMLATAWLIPFVISLYERNSRKTTILLMIGFFWGSSFLVVQSRTLANLSQNSYLFQYWGEGFSPTFIPSLQLFEWFYSSFFVLFRDAVSLPLVGLWATIYLIGVYAMIHEDIWKLLSLTFPVIIAFAAAFLHQYPFSGRLLIFLAPTVIILLAKGIDQLLIFAASRNFKLVGGLIVLILFFPPLTQAYINVRTPRMSEHIEPTIEYTYQNWQDGDLVYLYYNSQPAFTYYQPRYPFPESAIMVGVESREDWSAYFNELDELAANHERVWLIFSHVYKNNDINEETLFLRYLSHIGGRQLTKFRASRSTVYLFEFTQTADISDS